MKKKIKSLEERVKELHEKLDTVIELLNKSPKKDKKIKANTVAGKVFLSDDQKKALKKDSAKLNISQLIDKYGVSQRTVYRVINSK